VARLGAAVEGLAPAGSTGPAFISVFCIFGVDEPGARGMPPGVYKAELGWVIVHEGRAPDPGLMARMHAGDPPPWREWPRGC
jgi:hypothetical protein